MHEEELVWTDYDGNHDNIDGIFLDCSSFDITQDSFQIVDGAQDSFQIVDWGGNSLLANDNDVELYIDEPYSQTVANDNDVNCS